MSRLSLSVLRRAMDQEPLPGIATSGESDEPGTPGASTSSARRGRAATLFDVIGAVRAGDPLAPVTVAVPSPLRRPVAAARARAAPGGLVNVRFLSLNRVAELLGAPFLAAPTAVARSTARPAPGAIHAALDATTAPRPVVEHPPPPRPRSLPPSPSSTRSTTPSAGPARDARQRAAAVVRALRRVPRAHRRHVHRRRSAARRRGRWSPPAPTARPSSARSCSTSPSRSTSRRQRSSARSRTPRRGRRAARAHRRRHRRRRPRRHGSRHASAPVLGQPVRYAGAADRTVGRSPRVCARCRRRSARRRARARRRGEAGEPLRRMAVTVPRAVSRTPGWSTRCSTRPASPCTGAAPRRIAETRRRARAARAARASPTATSRATTSPRCSPRRPVHRPGRRAPRPPPAGTSSRARPVSSAEPSSGAERLRLHLERSKPSWLIARRPPRRASGSSRRLRPRTTRPTTLAAFVAGRGGRARASGAGDMAIASRRWAAELLDRYVGTEGQRHDWPDDEVEACDHDRRDARRARRTRPVRRQRGCLDVARSAVRSTTSSTRRLGGSAQFGDGVLVGTVGQAYAADLDTVFVLGAVEGVLPPRGRDDPLLPDRERRDISGLVPRATRRLEERRDYLAALAAGAERVLTFPRADPRAQREAPPGALAARERPASRRRRPERRAELRARACGAPWLDVIDSFERPGRAAAGPHPREYHAPVAAGVARSRSRPRRPPARGRRPRARLRRGRRARSRGAAARGTA